MSGFLNKAFLFFTVCSFSASFALAADAPHDTMTETVPVPAQESGDAGYEEAPPPSISESPVAKPSIDGFGTLEENHGGLPASVWKTSTRESADVLLSEIDSGVANDTIRNLLIRLLMTQATPPAGTSTTDWLTLRINTLINLGQDDKALQMISALPSTMTSEQILELQTGLQLAQGNYDKSCAAAQPDKPTADQSNNVFWKKLSILCQARAGKHDEAMVGLDILRETNSDEPFFQEQIRKIDDKTFLTRTLPSKFTLFDVAVIRAANDTDKLKDKIDVLPPVVLKYIAQDATLDIKLREKAANRAQQLGIIAAPDNSKTPEPAFTKNVASDVTTLATALGSGKPANDSDGAVIARLALDDSSIQDSRRIERLLTLMEPFGYKVPASVWQKLYAHKVRYDGEMPPARLVAQINDAAQFGRQAEVILLAALIAGNNDADKLPDLALLPIVKALKSVGFEKEARTLAFSAVSRY